MSDFKSDIHSCEESRRWQQIALKAGNALAEEHNRLSDTERQLREWKDAYTRDIAAAATRLREAQERSEYWKAEHLAGNREIDTLKERCERLEGAINEAFDCATLGHAENVLRAALSDEMTHEQDVFELMLCEQNHLILKPNQLYRFTVDETCEACRAIAAEYAEPDEQAMEGKV